MAMVKKWFIREGVAPVDLGRAMRACKEFTPLKQKDLLKLIISLRMEKFIVPGVKRRRIRKKLIKKEIAGMQDIYAFRLLDMMVEEWRDIPEDKLTSDKMVTEGFDALIKHAEEEDKKIFDALRKKIEDSEKEKQK